MTIAGKDCYLGAYGSDESYEEYARLIAEWSASGRQSPPTEPPPATSCLTISELILRYWEFAKTYYVKNGKLSGESENIRSALKPLRKLYGSTNANSFGPKAVELVRQAMIDSGLSRNSINARIGRIRRMFRWAAKHELIEPSVYHGLLSVECLQRGRSAARETKPVRTVPQAAACRDEIPATAAPGQ